MTPTASSIDISEYARAQSVQMWSSAASGGSCSRFSNRTEHPSSKRWRLVIGLGWTRCVGAYVLGWPRVAGVLVLSAFGRDAVDAVLGAGAAASRHHRGPIIAVVERWIRFGCRDTACG